MARLNQATLTPFTHKPPKIGLSDKTPAVVQLKKIIVPIDFSEPSLKALNYAAAFAQKYNAALCLVHVVEPASFFNDLNNVTLSIPDRDIANKLHHRLVMLTRRLIPKRVPASSAVFVGRPFSEIVSAASTFGADLIIIATHGYTGLKHAFMGSTAERVVRSAPCPVLIVREQERDFVDLYQPSTKRNRYENQTFSQIR